MHILLYILITITLIVYIGLLVALNKIPNVKVKGIGFFSLFGITIESKCKIIKIKKLRLRINLFRGIDSPLKLFNLEIADVDIKVLDEVEFNDKLGSNIDHNEDLTPSENLEGDDDQDEEEIDLNKMLQFSIPKRIYDIMFYYQILNQFHIILLRCSIYHEKFDKNSTLYFDYAKLENSLKYDGHNTLTFLIFNGYLHGIEDQERLQLFRNVEVIFSCDAIFNCGLEIDAPMHISIINFSLITSLGKAHIALDHLPIKKLNKIPNKHNQEKMYHPISKRTIKFLREFWKVFNETKLTLEDFKISSGPYNLTLATFQTSLSHNKQSELSSDSFLKSVADFQLHIASLKVFEAETKCFELPSATVGLSCNPFGLIQGIENTHYNQQIINELESLDIKLNIILSNPTIDVYHDQIMRMRERKFRNNDTSKENKFKNINFKNLMLCLKYVTTKVVIVDAVMTLHIPGFGVRNEFRRDDKNNLTLLYSTDSIVQRFATKDLSKMLLEKDLKKQSLYGLFKIKNFKIELLDNLIYLSKCNLLTIFNVHDRTISVKLNVKKFKIKSMNSAIFEAVREIKTRKILQENKIYSEMVREGSRNCEVFSADNISTNNAEGDELITKYVELFEVLPPLVKYIKVDIFDVQIDVICKDGLPLQLYYDEQTGETSDLKDYGRGVSLKLGRASLSYKKDKEEISSNIYNLQVFTLSEFKLDYVEDFDIVAMYNKNQSDFSDVSSLESIALAEKEEDDLRQVKKVFDVEEIEVNNFSNKQRDTNRLSVKVTEINGRVDIFLIWCSVYAATLLKKFSPGIERNCSKKEMKSLLGKQDKILKLDINVNVIAIVTRLPNHVDVLCEFDTFNCRDVFETRTIEFKYFRSYVVHPRTKLWSRFLTLKESFVTMNNANVEDENALDIVCQGVRLNIPHGFMFYTVFDNIVTFGKAIKQVSFNFNNLSNQIMNFESIKPEAKGAFNMPSVNLKSKILGITLENDPFENEISYILELGKFEQRLRIKKWKIFEKKSEQILNNTIDSKIRLQGNKNDSNPLNGSPTNIYGLKNIISDKGIGSNNNSNNDLMNDSYYRDFNTGSSALLSEETAKEKVKKARELLEYEISTSWIHKFKKFRATKLKNWKNRSERAWGEELVNDRIAEKFDILNYLPGPLLMGAFFRQLDLTVKRSPINDLDKFLHDFGKGQPKLDYSILVPLFFSIKSSGLFVFLRDYALPVLSFPDNDVESKPSFQLEGNFVINEKLVTRKEEMRYIWVPFSPPMAPELKEDSFYSVLVPRTLTPVKFMVDINCKIDSERAAMISWSKSYQSVFLAAMSALDNFTKPPIDDSPIGWWDKVGLLAHGRITFEIVNELCFHMKSSMDPYNLTGRCAGFVFCWKNNVILKIDGNGSPTEVVTLFSDDFLLAIPNYALAERKSWSLFYDEMHDDSFDDDAESKKYQKRVMELSSDEKVQWTLGFLFERNKNESSTSLSDKEERISKFRPHYDVIVTSPYFDWHPDSYKGFRSDYLHMALSVKSTSKNGNSSNTVHLTPLTFEYFFYWWYNITEDVALPVRQGSLFNSSNIVDKSHVKMSAHLFSVKYQLILDPLTISHLYMHSAGEGNKRITFTGLKARSSKVMIDLHQRKELLTYVNKKLNIENQIMHLKMNQAEVSFQDTDIRLVNAVFSDHSVQAHLATYLQGNSTMTDSSSGDTGEADGSRFLGWFNSLDVHGDDFSWIDQEDFIELEQREILSPYPKITVTPFCYSPKFTYIREFSLQEDGPFPFGRENTHSCKIGLEKPEDTQGNLLFDRLSTIKEELSANEELLKSLKSATQDPSILVEIKRVNEEIEITKDKQDLLQEVYEEITGKIAPGEETSRDELTVNSISRMNSRLLSVYSGHRSVDEANQVKLLNKEASEFHNRFIVHNLQFKWDNNLRDLFMTYMRLSGERRSEEYYLSRKAVELVESILNTVPEEFAIPKLEEAFCTECKAGEDVLKGFDDYLDDVNRETEEIEHKFLIKLIHPQIQLVSEQDPDSAALIVSKDLEMRIISVNVKDFSKFISADNEVSGLIETRYGGLFNSSSVLVFEKGKSVISHPNIPYGYVDGQLAVDWPPWIECENIYEGSWMKNELITQRNNMALTVRKPNYLYVDSSKSGQKDEIKVHIAKFVINADSNQYSTLYHVITDLLVHSQNEKNSLMNKLDKIMSLADNDDFYGLDVRVKNLQDSIREYHQLLLKLDIKSIKLNKTEKQEANQLELEVAKRRLELSTIMRGLGLRNMKLSTNKRASKSWMIAIDQIIWHLLDNNRKPFIDLALANAKFKRVDAMDGSNGNIVEVDMIQGFNLQENAVYPELLAPADEDSRNKNIPIILMSWKMLNPVGGIPIMQSAKLSIQPLKIQLDFDMSKKLFDYMFPKDNKKPKEEKNDKTVSTGRQVSRNSDVISSDVSSNDFVPIERPKNVFKNFINGNSYRHTNSNKSSQPPTPTDDEFDLHSGHSLRKIGSSSTRFSSSEDISVPPQDDEKNSGRDCKIGIKKKSKKKVKNDDADDIALILSRSSKFISIVDIEVEKVRLIISFKAPGHLNIIDVHNLSLNIPTLRYQNKTWSGEDFILRLRKDIIKVILQHTGQILGNKFKIRKRGLLKQPLKQISNYASFVSVQDLQGENNEPVEESRRPHHHHHQHLHRPPQTAIRHDSRRSSTNLQSFENMLQEIVDEEDIDDLEEDELESSNTMVSSTSTPNISVRK